MLNKIRLPKSGMFSLPKPIWILSISIMINTIGSSFLWPLNIVYMRQELGQTLVTASLVMLIMSVMVAVGNLLGGYLFDKIGGGRTCVIGVITTLCTLILLNINHGWPMYPILLPIVGLGQGLVQPALMAMIGTTWPEGGRKAYNFSYLLQNVGVALGTAMGGFVAYYSYNYTFLGYLFFYIIFSLIIWFFVRKIKADTRHKKEKSNSNEVCVGEKGRVFSLIFLSCAYMICWIGYIQWQGIIPDYVTQIGISLRQYGMFWTLNGILIVLFQPILQLIVGSLRLTIKVQIIAGMLIFICSFLLTVKASTFVMFLWAMGIMTVGEILVWPAIPTIVNEISPHNRSGIYQGIINVAATIGRSIGPFLGAIIVTKFDVPLLFMFLVALTMLAIIFVCFHDVLIKKSGERQGGISL